jgi:uncharacterized membrane protein YdjX (TVP38/TMEM64 family)
MTFKVNKRIFFLTIFPVLAIFAFVIFPQAREWTVRAVQILGSTDTEPVKAYIRSFGPWAVTVSFLLMVFQSVIAPLPAFLITFSNAAVFGWIPGATLSWSSAMAGAALCFAISRLYGRDAVARLTGKTALASVDGFFVKHGTKAILIARMLPFMPFDPVSYAAGLTPMRFRSFFIATGIGQLPATLVYSYAGDKLGGGARSFINGLLVVFAIVIVTTLLRSIFAEHKKKIVPVTQPDEPERSIVDN